MTKLNNSLLVGYKRVLRSKKDEKLPYDNPEQFGKELARKHLDMVREAVKEWESEKRKPSPSNKVKSTGKQGDSKAKQS